jgi:hypothetical protein
MAVGSTQPLTNEYQEYFLWGKGGRSRWLTFSLSYADCLEIWEPHPPGTIGPVQACNGIALLFFCEVKLNLLTFSYELLLSIKIRLLPS